MSKKGLFQLIDSRYVLSDINLSKTSDGLLIKYVFKKGIESEIWTNQVSLIDGDISQFLGKQVTSITKDRGINPGKFYITLDGDLSFWAAPSQSKTSLAIL